MSIAMLLFAVLLAALLMLAWTFVGYPLQIALQARWWPRPIRPEPWLPSLSVCIAVHNAEAQIEAKLDDLFKHDYPQDRIQVVVACDGCTDRTLSLLRAREQVQLLVLEFRERRGKSACLADAVKAASGEVLILNDVRQRLHTGALRALCAALAGGYAAVSGLLKFERSPGKPLPTEAYWAFEAWLRGAESRSGSVVGVTGALYAVRRSDFPSPPPGLILDDLWVPMRIAAAGGRIGLEPSAVVWDQPSASTGVEAARKRRTLAGNWQLLRAWPGLLLPGSHPLWWRLLGHKWLRLLMPFALAAALLSNLALLGRHPLLDLLALLQLLAWGLAALGLSVAGARRYLPIRLAAAFAELNLYALLGLRDHLRGGPAHLWQTTPAQPASSTREARS